MDKKIIAYRNNDVEFSHVWLDRKDIAGFIDSQNNSGQNLTLSIYEVMKELKCGRDTLRHLFIAGLLIPEKGELVSNSNNWGYLKSSVHYFQSTYITSSETAEIIGISVHMVTNWCKNRWLPVVSTPQSGYSHFYWFKKADIITWREERVSSAEMRDLLGIKQRTMENWIAKGRIKPLEKMCQHPYWFSKEDVMKLAIQRNDERICR